ncbi:MAG TPA: hypothetical protein VK171_10705 [Fimbriimonas sp.]|nr:hypothetical protein [Fimbriimonas sp.]
MDSHKRLSISPIGYAPSESGTYVVPFGGTATLPVPLCPNCNRPFARFLGVPQSVSGLDRIIDLLCCWRCGLLTNVFSYRQGTEQIEILCFGAGPEDESEPYHEFPDVLPVSSMRVAPLLNTPPGDLLFDEDWENHGLIRPAHQICGVPTVVVARIPICTECKRESKFLASVGDRAPDGIRLHGSSIVTLEYWYCRECNVVILDTGPECGFIEDAQHPELNG